MPGRTFAPPAGRSRADDEAEGVPESGFDTGAGKVSGGPRDGGSDVRPNDRDPYAAMGAEEA